MITIFKHHGGNCPPEFVTMQEGLGRIKRGLAQQVMTKIRAEKDKNKRDQLKLSSLPMIIFQGKFTSRHNKAMVEPSGFMIADFDGFPNAQTLKTEFAKIKADKYAYSVFISPSGNGLKLLIKIPICESNEEYNERFDSLNQYWSEKSKFWDKNNKGWVRTCFQSVDSNIYINEDSETFEGRLVKEVKKFTPRNDGEILTDSDRIFKILTEKAECKDLDWSEGNRNNGLFFMARRCNDYNIPYMDAESLVCNYLIGSGLPESEIKASLKSAYKNQSANKEYKDYSKKEPKTIQHPASTQQPEQEEETEFYFWERSSRGALKLNFYEAKSFLETNGFFRYEIDTSKYIFVRIINNIVEEVDLVHIKDFTLDYLEAIGEIEVYNMVAENSKFRKDYINCIRKKDIKWCKDIRDRGYLFFKNCFVEVNKEEIIKSDYKDLPGHIWKKQIIDRDFETAPFADFENCDVARFSKLVSNNQPDRLNAYICSMGYLMHGFKTYANAKAIIYNDEVLSVDGEPEGRSGKGLTLKFVDAMRVCITLPGKSFNFDKETSLQRVSQDTQVVFLDDVKKSFDFENLFNWITDGIIIRKLYAGEVWVPFNDAPKFAITTNYTIKGDNNSHDDRRFEIEIHPYFSPKHRPSDEFGREIFTGWDEKEWARFDNFMSWAMQLYLKEGLNRPNYVNLAMKKLVNKTNSDFVTFAENMFKSGERYEKKEYFIKMKHEFIEDPWYSSKSYTPHRFNGWMKAYAIYKGWKYKESGSGKKYLEFFKNDGDEVVDKTDLPF